MSQAGLVTLASGYARHHGIVEMSLEASLLSARLGTAQYALGQTVSVLIGWVSDLMFQMSVPIGQRFHHVHWEIFEKFNKFLQVINNINTIPYYRYHLQSVTCCSLSSTCRSIFLHAFFFKGLIVFLWDHLLLQHSFERPWGKSNSFICPICVQKNVSTFQYSASFLGTLRLHLNKMKR